MNRSQAARLSAVALLVFACALFALAARWPGYSHLAHPVALPGAVGLPGALLFDAMVFVLPGTSIGRPASRADMRATLRLSSPAWLALP